MAAIDFLRRIFLGPSTNNQASEDNNKAVLHPSTQSSQYLNDYRDIDNVGETKLLSYLSDWAMIQNCIDASRLRDKTIQRGMNAVILSREYQSQGSSLTTYSLYAYDGVKLQEFLDYPENKRILEQADWPVEAAQFVENVYRVQVDPKKNIHLYDLIAFAFNDARYSDYQPPEDGPRRFIYPLEPKAEAHPQLAADPNAKPRYCV